MFGSVALEVGIGIALLFFFMSLIASAFVEAMENVMKIRSRQLELAIGQLLPGLTEKFYKHPIIAALYPGEYKTGAKSLPSYIPRSSFSLAVIDLLTTSYAGKALSLSELAAKLDAEPKSNEVQRVMALALNAAGDDIGRVRAILEEWFDGTMDRCAGWYTRRSGRILMIVGLLAAIFFNVDAITVAQRLSLDGSLRSAVLVAAQAKVTEDQKAAGNSASEQAETPPTDQGNTDLLTLSTEFRSIGYPIGWAWSNGRIYPAPQSCQMHSTGAAPVLTCEVSKTQILSMIIGWLVTTLAVMLGAPFWFDVMNKLVVIRSTVKPKEKSPDELQ